MYVQFYYFQNDLRMTDESLVTGWMAHYFDASYCV